MITKEQKIDVLLRQAHACATGHRSRTYSNGKPETHFEFVARLMDAYIERKQESAAAKGVPWVWGAADQVIAMLLVKIARLTDTPTHADSWRDIAGYAACGAQVTDADLSDQPIPDTEKPL